MMVLRTVGRRQWLRPRVWMAIVAVTCLVSCGSGEGPPEADGPSSEATITATDSDAVTANSVADPDALECERRGEPCTLAEVSPEVLEKTGILLEVAADYLGLGVAPETLADLFSGITGVVETGWDDLGVFFRTEGGPPAWVFLEELDGRPVDGAWPTVRTANPGGAAGTLPTGLPTAAIPVGRGVSFAQTGGGGGIAGTPGEGKRAVVVSPYAFAMTAELEPILRAERDFRERGGTVELRVRDHPVAPDEILAPFLGWDGFDTIVLATHGMGVCEQGPDGALLEDDEGNYVGCRTVMSAGPVLGTLEEVQASIGDTTGVVVTQSTTRWRTDITADEADRLLVEVCLPAIEAYPSAAGMDPCSEPIPDDETRPVKVGLTADFFATVYPGGLPDRLIALMTCHSMRFDDIASQLLGGTGVVLGFPLVVWSDQAAVVRAELAETIVRGLPVQDALSRNAERYDTIGVGSPRWRHIGNDALRGRDVVALLVGDDELRDGGFVTPTTTGNGELAFEVVVRVSRVGEDESADAFRPEIRVDGEVAVRDVPLSTTTDDEWFSEVVEVPLPDGFEPGDRFDAEVRVQLPSGGESKWRYEDLHTELAIRYQSHVVYDFPTHRMEAVMVAEGRLEQGADGWQASLPMRWESASLTGVPQCQIGTMTAVTTFEVFGGSLDGEGATLRWGVGVDGDEIQDRIEIVCSGTGGHIFGGIIAQGLGAAVGVAGMIVVHGPQVSSLAWVADDFRPSEEAGVLLEHGQQGSFEEIDAEVRIQIIEP